MADGEKEEQRTDNEVKTEVKEQKPVEKKEEPKTEETKTEQKPVVKETQADRDRDNSVYIGGKPFMNYVTGVVMQFTTKGVSEVIIKGRGKFISRVVDVAQVVEKRFLEDKIELKDIKIDSEDFKNKEGRDVRVSTIEITLKKK